MPPSHTGGIAERAIGRIKIKKYIALCIVEGGFKITCQNLHRVDKGLVPVIQYWNWAQECLLTPTSSTQDIVQCALRCTQRIFRQGYQYKRAGVIVAGICPDSAVQTNFIDYDSETYEKKRRLDEAIDRINRENGSETIVLGAQQYTTKDGKKITAGAFRDSIKHDFRSPSYTTKWSDIPEAR